MFLGPGAMGCTASVILFEGLRRVLHRNCGYVCKPELEAEEPEEDEDTLSRRESLAITPPAAASSSVVPALAPCPDPLWESSQLLRQSGIMQLTQANVVALGVYSWALGVALWQKQRRVEEQKERLSRGRAAQSEEYPRGSELWIMQGKAGRAARKDAVCETPQQGRSVGEMEIEGETAAPVGVKPKVIEPLDYESVLVQRKTQILSDVLRDMLQFPIDDFQISTLKRQGRTLYSSVPDGAEKRASSLLVQEALGVVSGERKTILPPAKELNDIIKDSWARARQFSSFSQIKTSARTSIKTYNSDWHVVNYKYEDYSGDFRQLPNKVPRPEKLASHVFEDATSLGSQRGGVSKHGWLYKANMNSAISVTMRNSKVRRFAFELKMQDKSTYLLAADSEGEMDDWISTLNKILHSSFELAMQERRNGELHDDDELGKTDISPGNFQDSFQRLDLSGIEPDVKQFEEKFGKRVLVSCNDLSFNLQSCVAENEEGPTTNNSRKISADFHVDLNHPLVRSMIPLPSMQINGGMDTPHGEMLLSCSEGFKECQDGLQQTRPIQDAFRMGSPMPQGLWIKALGSPRCTGKTVINSQKKTFSNCWRILGNCVTPSYIPVRPFENNGPSNGVLLEVEEFVPCIAKCSQPFTTYNNHLYVYPKHLKYDNQKSFAKARNIAVCVEFRESDEEDAQPLKCIYGRPGGPLFTKHAYAAVLHHQQNPEFYDEHHLLFTFYHISCDSSTKKRDIVETLVGSAWLPLLKDGRVVMSEQQISVASNLPNGYLSCQEGVSKHSSPDIKWVDGGRPLFKVSTHLVSTIYTQDQHLHNFFHHFQSMQSGVTRPTEGELVKYLKSLHAMEGHVMINFLPTILNQLVHVLTSASNEDVAVNTTRVMVHIVAQCHEEGLEHYLRSYVKYVFRTDSYSISNGKTVHEELAKAMTSILKPSTDFLTSNKLLKYSWYFFEALVKSMAQHLMESGKVKLSRNQRFTASFHHAVETLVNMLMPHITQKYKDNLDAARNANHSLAVFIKTLYEFKFEFLRVVCNHEHYIPLNLPMPFGKGRIQRFQAFLCHIKETHARRVDLQLDYSLTDDFCRNHFLVGLLLREVCGALQEFGEVRQIAIQVLKSLMIKHTFDDRYASKSQQARLATLYLPLFGLLQENVHRLNVRDTSNFNTNQNGRDEHFTSISTATPQKPVGNLDNSLHKDVFGVISGTASPHTSTPNIGSVRHADSRGSLVSTDSGNSIPEKTNEKTSSLDKVQLITVMISIRPKIISYLPCLNRISCLHIMYCESDAQIGFDLTLSFKNNVTVNGGIECSGGVPSSSTCAQGGFNWSCDVFTLPHVSNTLHEHTQSASALGSSMLRCDKLDREEIKNLLMCFLHVLKSMSEDALFTYWNKATTSELMDFFTLVEVCLHQFRYMGKRFIARSQEGVGFMAPDRKSLTLPVSRNRGGVMHTRLHQLGSLENAHTFNHTYCHGDADACLLEANVSTEVCLTVLDTLSVFIMGFKTQLCADLGHNPLMKKVFQVHLCFLQIPQSETALKQVFTSLRTFIFKFPCTFFDGRADMCACLCYEILKCCNSKLSSIRSDAAHLLYFLMKSNFEYNGRKSFVVIAVSQLIADVIGIGGTRFQQSLSIINNCANSDKTVKHTAFPSDVKDLTKRIRTVLMATEQMKEHEKDPEMLVDLQYSLAKSYTSTPELRKTWLDSMAKIHAAMCYVHVAALVAEYLKRKGMFRQGCSAFRVITPNIDEEAAMMEDVGMQDVHFNEKLAHLYDTLHRAYTKVMEVMHSGKRLLGTFFRVAFFGQGFFEDEDGKEYIYKEPKFTPLSEISQRLLKLYSDKFGQENVKMIQDSGRVNPKDLEAKFAYIQVTHVTPYLEEKELEERKTDFERSHNIRRFVFETPFTESGKRHGGVEEQCKRRTVLTTTHCFPYVKKRIAVMYQHHTDLSPIEVAIDEMSGKVAELRALCATSEVDMIRLQLKLQGSISVQVNAGPLAYARAFLDDACAKKYPDNKVKQLKEVFRQFVEACGQALAVNERLIKEDQQEYHDEMKASYKDLARELSHIMHEQISAVEGGTKSSLSDSLHIFNAISGTPSGTTLHGMPSSASSV
ncbi:Dedicator of cytokinesis protein 9 [Labeo rohita]|uniref:Dedicator of cytokinesis protein 9 n=1 Tax=Labeo rohita TaxID=84645 RepID=A0ABQ8MKH0_LABRO|nr:Dedicator of cytokinesis protein 9 [Labeo rohita]